MLDVVKPFGASPSLEVQAVRGARRAVKTMAYWLAWPARAWAARQMLEQLAALSDHDLADIGLLRSDIGNAAAGPADADPSPVLQRVRNERRLARDLSSEDWKREAA